MSIKVAFLDRDGVINRDLAYIYKIEDFEFVEGVIEALQLLQKKGYALIVVTNQSGIGRGYYTEADYQNLTNYYRNLLKKEGVEFLDILHCPHHPSDNCECRKPKPGMFLQSIKKYNIDIENSLMFGDRLTDMQAAAAAGIKHRFLISQDEKNIDVDSSCSYKKVESVCQCLSDNKTLFQF